jgi:hypothetical protein
LFARRAQPRVEDGTGSNAAENRHRLGIFFSMAASFFKSLQDLFTDKRTDIGERFQILREAVNGTMSNFHMALDHTTGKTVGLKIRSISPAKAKSRCR